ncbi:MAG: vitamin K epoxide reductase family protein [Candidatus Magasanikbacteria bacterium]|nr:vitamin K epoxide reductase family protein [Candidatus Magasanikbacteria bacterium]
MKSLELLSSKLAAPSNKFSFGFLAVSAVGFVDATYLTAKHFLGEPITCSILHGCEQVTASEYSIMFGLPVALLGALYYLSVLLLITIYLQTKQRAPLLLVSLLTLFGFLFSLRFVYLQIFVIKAICIFCMVSATTSTLLFIFSLTFLKKNKTNNTPEELSV